MNQVDVVAGAAARAIEVMTLRSESIARRWVTVPGVIGVVTFLVGLALLVIAMMETSADGFAAILWGGVVLIAVGAASATASAIVAAERADPGQAIYPMPGSR